MYHTKIHSKSTVAVGVHLISNAKNVMQKTSGNVFLGHIGGLSFYSSNHGVAVPNTSVDHVAIFNSNPMQPLRWSLYCKKRIGNG